VALTCVLMLAFMRHSTSPSHASTLPFGIIGLSNGTCARASHVCFQYFAHIT
jgi:hypothetical protein